MRVLVISNMYPPHALGGYERSCADVMTRFAERGHQVHVLTTDTRLPEVADEPQPNVHRLLRWYWDDHSIVQPPFEERFAIERHNRAAVQTLLRETKPDVVSVWAMGALSLGIIAELNHAKVPVAYVVCDEWPIYGPRLDAWVAGFQRRRARLLAPLVRAAGLRARLPAPENATFLWLSEYIRNRVLTATRWEPAQETVTYSGIDTRDFPLSDDSVVSDEFGWRLLGVGRVEPRKGFSAAVEALAQLPAHATLRIAGPDDGEQAALLMGLAEHLGVADRLQIGAVPRAELREVYAAADVFVFTSAWQEPFGLTPVEAMACGTPVVAAATGGALEYLEDDVNCLVVPPRDAAAIAAAVRRLSESPRLRERLVAGGRQTATRLTIDLLTDVMEQWHRSTIERTARKRAAS
jgi:glycosyltransferase involved in cell wall biosynthesis